MHPFRRAGLSGMPYAGFSLMVWFGASASSYARYAVRNLAQRPAQATGEVKAPALVSVDRVEAVGALDSHAGQVIDGAVEQMRSLCTWVIEIGTVAPKQEQDIDQVGVTVSQLDQVIRQSAALVGQCAKTATSPSQQARGVIELIAVLRLCLMAIRDSIIDAPWSAATGGGETSLIVAK